MSTVRSRKDQPHAELDIALIRAVRASIGENLPVSLTDLVIGYVNYINEGYHTRMLWEFRRFSQIIPSVFLWKFCPSDAIVAFERRRREDRYAVCPHFSAPTIPHAIRH